MGKVHVFKFPSLKTFLNYLNWNRKSQVQVVQLSCSLSTTLLTNILEWLILKIRKVLWQICKSVGNLLFQLFDIITLWWFHLAVKKTSAANQVNKAKISKIFLQNLVNWWANNCFPLNEFDHWTKLPVNYILPSEHNKKFNLRMKWTINKFIQVEESCESRVQVVEWAKRLLNL